jgi:hypothetical protein
MSSVSGSTIEYATPVTPAPRPGLRRWPLTATPEPRRQRWLGTLVAIAIAAIFALGVCTRLYNPAHDGVDQNGYLVGGKQYAHSLSTGLKLDHPLGFVGNMWVYNPTTETYYPKYPIGLPMIYATSLKLFGDAPDSLGRHLCHAVSPLMATLGLLATFALGRAIAGTYAGLLSMLMMLGCQYTLPFSINPNSHATSFAVVTWGMFFLFRFAQTASPWRGAIAGLLLGFAVLVRYTEGLLLLPMLVVAFGTMRWTNWRAYLIAAIPFAAWALPVFYQVAFNWFALGTLTSYGPTNESTGFSWQVLVGDWDRTIRTINDNGLYFVAPIGLLGLLAMLFLQTRSALLLVTWVLPSLLLYGAYYWAPNVSSSYGRFFYTQFPAIVVAAAWAMCTFVRETTSTSTTGSRLAIAWRRGACTVAIAAVVAFAIAVPALRTSLAPDAMFMPVNVGAQSRNAANLAAMTRDLVAVAPPGSVVVSERTLAQHFQFAGDWRMFDHEMFSQGTMARMLDRSRRENPDDPDPIDPGRIESLKGFYKDKDDAALTNEFEKLALGSFATGQRVFVVLRESNWVPFRSRFVDGKFEATTRVRFVEAPYPLSDLEKLDEDRRPPRPITIWGRGNRAGPPQRPAPGPFFMVELTAKPQAPAPQPTVDPAQQPAAPATGG